MGDEVRAFELPAIAHVDPATVQRGSEAGGGAPERAGDGLQDGGRNRTISGEEGNADAPVVAAVKKGPGAVDRIDEIGEGATTSGAIVQGFLRQPAIGRT